MQLGAGQGNGTDVLSLWYDICLQLIYGNRTQTDQSTVITSFYSVVSIPILYHCIDLKGKIRCSGLL